MVEEIPFSDYKNLKIILVENKIDLNREITEEQINEFMEKNEININMKISIKEGTGIEDLADRIKNIVNDNNINIPINFGSQNINEYKNDFELNKDLNKLKTINMIFIGNSTVGKTSLYLRFNKNFYKDSFISTIGIDHSIKTYKYKNELYKINLCDTAGQDRYRTLPKKYYINANGVFLLFDLSNKESFNDVSVWMNEVKQHLGNTKDNKGPIIYLVGNKLDIVKRVISKEQAEGKASFYGIKYYEISCKLNINVQEVYSRMIVDCSKNIVDKGEQEHFQIKIEKKKKTKSNKLCC